MPRVSFGLAALRERVRRSGNVGWALADQAFVSGANFLTGLIIARALGVAQFGVFSLAWMVILFIQSIQFATITSPMSTVGPKQSPCSASSYYAASLTQQIIFSCASIALLIVAASVVEAMEPSWGVSDLIVPLAICTATTQLHEFLRRYNYALSRAHVALFGDALRYGLQLVGLAVLFFYYHAGGVRTALEVISGCALIGILSMIPNAPKLKWEPAPLLSASKRNFQVSTWLLGSALLQWTTNNLFVVAAGATLGPAAVGAIRASQNLVGITHVFFQAADNIVPPKAARVYHSEGAAGLWRFTKLLLLVSGIGTGLVCLLIGIPADLWLRLFFGSAYVGYGYVVAGLAISYFVVALALPFQHALLAREKTRPIFIGYVLGTIFTLLSFHLLISQFGLAGVVAGIIMVESIHLVVLASSQGIR